MAGTARGVLLRRSVSQFYESCNFLGIVILLLALALFCMVVNKAALCEVVIQEESRR
jgi:hypothetical protein